MGVLENARYELFAQAVARGVRPPDAYVQAGFESQSKEAISNNASRLAQDERIMARVQELLQRMAMRTELKADDVKAMLLEDRELARQIGQPSAAIRAAELLGKQLGMFVEKREIRTGSLDDIDPDQLDAIREAAIAESARRIAEGSGAGEAVPQDPDVLPRPRPVAA